MATPGGPAAERTIPAVWDPRGLRLPRLSDRALLGILLIGVGIAGWPTLSALLSTATGDTPVSFVPLVPIIGAVFLLMLCDGQAIRAYPRDGFVDGLSLLVLVAASSIVLLVLPTAMSWYYWLDRLDVVGLLLVLMTLVVAVWGVPGLARLAPGLLYLLLAWPLPYLVIYNRVIPLLTVATAQAVRAITPLLPLGIRADPQSSDQILIPFHGELNHIIIAQACAGINGALGLVVVGLPLAYLAKGSGEARASWLALGLGLSWFVNLSRICVIAAGVAVWGPDVALNLVHPMLGIVLFAGSFALLLWLAPLCRLDVAAPWRPQPGSRQTVQPTRSLRSRRWVLLAIILGATSLLDYNLSQFDWLSEATLPRIGTAQAGDLFHALPNWRQVDAEPLQGWQPLFGSTSISRLLVIQGPEAPLVFVQAVLAKDLSAFNTYGVEQCYAFHGYNLDTVQHIALGNGVTGTLVDFRRTDGKRTVSLYWLQPVQTSSGLFHERIVLGTDAEAFQALPAVRAPDTAGGIVSVAALANTVVDYLSPWGTGDADPAYLSPNHYLELLAQGTIAHERTPTG